MPPAMADSIPSSAAANQLAPLSTAMAAPEVAKKPMPTASSISTSRFILMTARANTVATAAAASATVMLGQCCIEFGGLMSSSRSRRIPPPTPVSTAITAIPNRSKPFRTPTTAPEAANTAIPAKFRMFCNTPEDSQNRRLPCAR